MPQSTALHLRVEGSDANSCPRGQPSPEGPDGRTGFGGSFGPSFEGPFGRATKLINMAHSQLDKSSVIADFKTHESDTGSPEVQIALLTQRISHLTDHLRTHRKDFHSRRGLIAMTSRRRKLLDYVKRHNLETYKQLLERLKIRR
ncbi:MAG: hypothetical protein RL648_1433 [Verrucomicrobiota bacterium]|jgi:small subunit ribosomal protein S15